MAAPTDPLTGDALLEAVNDAMIALHERYYHRAPASARTQLLDDEILACLSAQERKLLSALLGKIEDSLDLIQTSEEADAKQAY